MATRSILTDVKIKSKPGVRKLIKALELSENSKANPRTAEISKSCQIVEKSNIEKFFKGAY